MTFFLQMDFILSLWGFHCKMKRFVSITFYLKNNCSRFQFAEKLKSVLRNFFNVHFSTPKPHQTLVLKHLSPAPKMIRAETPVNENLSAKSRLVI